MKIVFFVYKYFCTSNWAKTSKSPGIKIQRYLGMNKKKQQKIILTITQKSKKIKLQVDIIEHLGKFLEGLNHCSKSLLDKTFESFSGWNMFSLFISS